MVLEGNEAVQLSHERGSSSELGYVVDARTGVTTQLLSDQGFVVTTTDLEEAFAGRDFEKKFFA